MTQKIRLRTGRGSKAKKFVDALIANPPVECVTWPMWRDYNGYGRVAIFLGDKPTIGWAHRVICEMVNGTPPSPDHEAAHACGNGKDGCVNPRHLSWQTRTRNQLDRRAHGTKSEGIWKHHPKLSAEMALQIVRLKDTLTQRELAKEFGVTDATIRDVLSGKTWGHVTGIKRAAA